MIRVAVAAVSDVARAGLSSSIARMADVDVVGQAGDAETLARLIAATSVDVVAVDAGLRQDAAAPFVDTVAGEVHVPGVVLLTDEAIDADAPDGRRAGALAILPRQAGDAELEAAIRAVAVGLNVTHPALAERTTHAGTGRSSQDGSVLTPREIEVLRMLAAGLPNKAIARRLGVSAHTVKFHVGSIMSKLHASSRTEAVTDGIRRGLIFV